MKRAIWFSLLVLACRCILAGTLPPDVLNELTSYNVTWTTPSTNGSPGSMPIGNGDITGNVWVENNGGDLVMYLGKSDSWSEGTRLLKIGRTRFRFSPNPFASGSPFSQTLNFYNGEIDITAGQSGSQVFLRIYADANQPVIRVFASGQASFSMSCSNEIWRTTTLPINSTNSDSFRGVAGATPAPSESADQVVSLPDRLMWYHQNAGSYFASLFNAENLSGYAGSYSDPWTNRIFGATILATNFSVVSGQELQSTSGTNFLVSIFPYTAQTNSESGWQNQMNNLVAQVAATPETTARTNHYAWWDAFWNRSWIFVSGDSNATTVTSGYLEQRYVEACQGRSAWPIKFNGGTFTFDNLGENGDYRAWGPGYWNQNTRLLYWPMLASGDFDMMMPFFNIYTNMLPLQTAATLQYYRHGGAFFPETFNIFGLYYGDDWGWNNSSGTTCEDSYIKYHYQGGLETLGMMLAYYNYTQDSTFATNDIVPFATQAIRFFEDHWPIVNSKFVFYPANACETYWGCTNSTDYISGLMSDIQQLMALPANLTTPALIQEWKNCYAFLPPLPMDPSGSYIKPAQTYGPPENSENPECYCIFPYRLFGLGLTNYNIGLATFENRTIQTYKYDWSQDPIEEALVGLTSAAQTDVINNFNDTYPTCRFRAFWNTRNDYVPTEDTGGAAMSALQFMLLQCAGTNILLLPSWPPSWNVDFKLNAPGNSSVRLILTNGTVTQLTVSPSTLTNNLVEPLPAAPTGLAAEAGAAQAALFWNPVAGASGYNLQRSIVSGGPYATVGSGLTGTSYLDTGLANGTNYYYVVSALNVWGQSTNSPQVTVTPGVNVAVKWEGDLIANVQSVNLSSSSKVWTNQTSDIYSVSNFSTIEGGFLNVASVAYGASTIKALFVDQIGNDSVQSSLKVPLEIVTNHPSSVDAWIYPVTVNQTSCYLNYGYQGGSLSPMNDREYDFDTSGHGVISGDFGSLDTGWATPPTANTWHYVAVTYDGTNLLAYVDGSLNVTHVIGTPIATVQTLMQVGSAIAGAGSTGGNDPFQGYIACARAESGVLTASDIANNYAMGPLGTAAAITPGGLVAVSGDGQVQLSWNASANAASYNVKRSSNLSGVYNDVATNLTALGYTNTALTDGMTYYYAVSAVNAAGESANSAVASAEPVSLTPPGLNVAVDNGQLQLTWPQDHIGWSLQAQTNSIQVGLGTNWVTVPASTLTNQMNFPINPASGAEFFRLAYP
jgi:alpha-L-fucosidase 2